MGITVTTTNDASGEAGLWVDRASTAGPSWSGVAWLLPDRDRAVARRRALAQEGHAFDVDCQAMDDFVDDRWGLLGTGARVDAAQRAVLMRRALREARETDGVALPGTPGTVELAAQAAEVGLGLPAFERALDDPDADGLFLLPSERDLLRVLGRYRRALRDRGLRERSEVLAALARDGSAAWPIVVVEGAGSLDAAWAFFFSQVGRRTDVVFLVQTDEGSSFDPAQELVAQLRAAGARPERASRLTPAAPARAAELQALSAALYDPASHDAVSPTCALRVLLPAGRYAQARAVADAVSSSGAVDAVVACNDPAALASELAGLMTPHGWAVQARGSMAFSQTDLGRTLLGMCALAQDDVPDVAMATDAALGAVLGLDRDAVASLDARWRGDRRVDAAGLLDDIEQAVDGPRRAFVQAARRGDLVAACDVAESLCGEAAGMPSALRAEDMAAIRAARRLVDAAQEVGEGPACVLEALPATAVSWSWAFEPRGDVRGRVRVMSHGQAAALPPASVQLLVACDLTSDLQRVRIARTPLDALLEKLGCAVERDALTERRVAFAAEVRAAREGVMLERVRNDVDCAPLSPAVVLQDVLDCYLDHGAGAEQDARTGLPAALAPFASMRGEELLGENLGGATADVPRKQLPVGPPDLPSHGARRHVLLPRADVAALHGRPALSPSALEEYLECPYKWFADRRLRLGGVDVGFGPLEKGTFAHAVLRRYYELWRAEEGDGKADLDHLGRAFELLDRAFDAELEEQGRLDPGDGPLVAVDQAEARQVDDMRRALRDFLRYDAQLLPGFSPRLLEWRFGHERAADYAGFALVGIIDRVDCDEEGRAVVIDYKSSLKDRFHLVGAKGEEFALPARVQALAYAQVLRRLTGTEVVGALYLNTLGGASQPRVCGAYADELLGPESLPGVKPARDGMRAGGFTRFEDLLDAVEALVAERIRGLADGDVPRRPRDAGACEHCLVLGCDQREAS